MASTGARKSKKKSAKKRTSDASCSMRRKNWVSFRACVLEKQVN
jgi:hypothetical protein